MSEFVSMTECKKCGNIWRTYTKSKCLPCKEISRLQAELSKYRKVVDEIEVRIKQLAILHGGVGADIEIDEQRDCFWLIPEIQVKHLKDLLTEIHTLREDKLK